MLARSATAQRLFGWQWHIVPGVQLNIEWKMPKAENGVISLDVFRFSFRSSEWMKRVEDVRHAPRIGHNRPVGLTMGNGNAVMRTARIRRQFKFIKLNGRDVEIDTLAMAIQ